MRRAIVVTLHFAITILYTPVFTTHIQGNGLVAGISFLSYLLFTFLVYFGISKEWG